MAGRWIEVVRLSFIGERFRDHALDLLALAELSHFQRMVAETAKEVWRASNPQRERLPSHFEERTRLCLRRIEPGSAVAPLEVFLPDEDQKQFWETQPVEVKQAISLAYEVFRAVDADASLPETFPKTLLPEYAQCAQYLASDEALQIEPPGLEPVRFTPAHRQKLTRFVDEPYEASTLVTGKVLEADVRQMRFQLWIDDRTSASVAFSESQEGLVTTALKEHKSLSVRASGRGQFNRMGRLLRMLSVEDLEVLRPGPTLFDLEAPSIEDELDRIAAEVPQSEWDRLPADLSSNLDHYIYGTPKQ